jgi:hypothetical protein
MRQVRAAPARDERQDARLVVRRYKRALTRTVLIACSLQAVQGFNDDVYAASEIMSSIESFSTTGFMSALPAPPRTPARKS